MNANSKLFKAAGATALGAFLATAYAFAPQDISQHEIVISAPFKVESIDLAHNKVDLLTTNEEYALEVEFEAEFFKDGNGFSTWNEVNVESLKEIKAYNEDGGIENFYIPREDISNIVALVETSVKERL